MELEIESTRESAKHWTCSKSVLFILLILGAITSTSCIETDVHETAQLGDATAGMGLLVGCAVFEQRALQDAPLMVVLGRCDTAGRQIPSLLIVTDSLGFFTQEVPPGTYWIGSVRTDPSRRWSVSYYYSNYEYQRRTGSIVRWWCDYDLFWGIHAEKPDSTFSVNVGQATDLGYLVLSTAIMHLPGWTPGLDPDYAIPAYLKTLEGHRSFQDELYYHQTVPAYFEARFPDSEWVPALRRPLRTSYPDTLR